MGAHAIRRKCQLGRYTAREYGVGATARNVYSTITKLYIDYRTNDPNDGLLFAIIDLAIVLEHLGGPKLRAERGQRA